MRTRSSSVHRQNTWGSSEGPSCRSKSDEHTSALRGHDVSERSSIHENIGHTVAIRSNPLYDGWENDATGHLVWSNEINGHRILWKGSIRSQYQRPVLRDHSSSAMVSIWRWLFSNSPHFGHRRLERVTLTPFNEFMST